MRLTLLVSFLILRLSLAFEQNAYIINIEYLEKQYINKKYFTRYDITYTHVNRTYKAISGHTQVMKELDTPAFQVISQVYIRLQNVYKTFAPIRFRVDVCQALRSNIFGVAQVKTIGNVTDCPIKLGYYYIKNFPIVSTKFPPNFPAGHFKVQITLMYRKEIMSNFSVAYEIKYLK